MKQQIKKNWQIYLLFLPVLLWIIFFVYVPFITNMIIAFQDYNIDLGIGGSTFIGWENFKIFFSGDNFLILLKNTLFINLLILFIGFPLAIALAIMIFEVSNKFLKGFTQTATFLPYFVSAVVISGIVIEFLRVDTGMITHFLALFGVEPQNFLANPKYFRLIYALMDLWKTLGYNALIYFAALSAIDPTLYEAARLDGASKWQQITKITIPSLMPIIITTFLLRLGRIMQLGYEQILLLQNDGNRSVSEIIGTYVYNVALAPRVGLPNYGVAAVVGIFDAVVAIVLIFISNRLAKKFSGTSLW